jgi:SSS family solute:Na+ symporter
MSFLALALLATVLVLFVGWGLRAARHSGGLDDYLTARNSQSARALGWSFLASGLGAWILFVPPEIAAFVGPVALLGYAIAAALPFLILGWLGRAIRQRLPVGQGIGDFTEACHGRLARRGVEWVSVAYMAIFLAAELTAIGAITGLLSDLPPALVMLGVALTTLVYTTVGGLRASLATDRLQGVLLLALLGLVAGVVLWRAPGMTQTQPLPAVPLGSALSVALTLVIAVTAANLFHQGYWQRLWAAQDAAALRRGAWLGGGLSLLAVALMGGFGMLAVVWGLPLGEPAAPFFALLAQMPAGWGLVALLLAVTLVASSVDTLQNGIASLLVSGARRAEASLTTARWITVLLMLPVLLVALQGYSVLRLFLIADLLCAAIVVPVLLGLWRSMHPAAALAGGAAGLLGTVLPGWVTEGSLRAGLHAASFPDGIPTLPPFLGALLASSLVSISVARWLSRHPSPPA